MLFGQPMNRVHQGVKSCILLGLLALLLPGDVTAGWPVPNTVVQPSDNPAWAVGMQVFEPALTSGGPLPAGAPAIGEWTRAAGPDDTIVVAGWQISSFTGAQQGRDVRFRFFGQTGAGDATWADGAIQSLDGDKALVTLPAALPAGSAYLFWIANGAATSFPQRVNMADAWWVGPDAATRGDAVWVFGRDLLLPGHTNGWVYLQPAAGAGQWLPTTTNSNPYRIEFTVPAGLANGTYEVWTHNGGGGAYGWSGPLSLTVNDGLPWTTTTFNVKSCGAVGDGVTDDTAAIKSALTAADAVRWSTVYFPTGTYQVSQMLGIGNELRLLGAGRDASILRAVDGFNAQFMIDYGGNAVEMARLMVNGNALNAVRMDTVVWLRGHNDLRIIDCRWDTRGSAPSDLHSCRRVLFRNVEVYQGTSFFVGNSGQIFFEGCHLYGFGGHCNSLFGGFGANDLSISGCTADHYGVLVGDPDPDVPIEPMNFYKGRFIADQPHWSTSRRHYLGQNRLNNAAPPLFMNHTWQTRADAAASGGSALYGWGNMGNEFGRDGSGTWTASDTNLPQTLTVDLGVLRNVAETRIDFYKYSSRTLTYEVDSSTDNAAWTSRVASKASGRILWNTDTFGAATARYVRVRITGCSPSDTVGITELECYESGTHNRLVATNATASSNSSTASRAIDAAVTIRDRSPRARYAAQFVKTGTHYVWVRGRGTLINGMRAALVAESDSCHVGLNGATPDTAAYLNGLSDTNDPAAYVWRNITDDVDAAGIPRRALLAIPTVGTNTMDLYIHEDGCLIDKVLLTTNPDYVPSGAGPEETVSAGAFVQQNTADGLLVLEAEHATAVRAGVAFVFTVDQNSGEQIMWESNNGTDVGTTVLSADASSITLSGAYGEDASRMVVVTDGKGLGQSRDLSLAQQVPFNEGSNTILSVSEPWNVIPDSGSKVVVMRAVRRAVVYGNLCDATDRCWTGSQHVASAGVQTYKGGADVILANNTFHELRTGVSLWSTDPEGPKPVTSWLCTGNAFRKVRSGVTLGNGISSPLANSIFANVLRNNTFDTTASASNRVLTLTWSAHGHAGYDADALIFEHNQVSNAAGIVAFTAGSTAISNAVGNVLFYRNRFIRGTSAFAGSRLFDTSATLTGVLPLLRENTSTGFETNYLPAIRREAVLTPPCRVLEISLSGDGATNTSLPVWNSGTAALAWTATNEAGPSWLTLGTNSGTIPDQAGQSAITLGVNAAGLSAGAHEAVLRLSAGGVDRRATVRLLVAGPPPAIPAAPSGLGATAISTGRIDLVWMDNATNETGFQIERKKGTGGTYGQIAAVGANVTNYSNAGLVPGTTYVYRVRASNDDGFSAYSPEAQATTPPAPTPPAAPSGLSALAVSSAQIELAWTDNATNETGFTIERKRGVGGTYGQIATLAGNTIGYTDDAGLLAGTTYVYRVRATNAVGPSGYSGEAQATTGAGPGGGGLGGRGEGTVVEPLHDTACWIKASGFTAASNMAITSVMAKVKGVTGRYRCAVYTDEAGAPARLLGGTREATNPPTGWQTFVLTQPLDITAGVRYWLAIWSDAAGAGVYAGTGGVLRCGAYPYGPWPDPIATTASNGVDLCLFAPGLPPRALLSIVPADPPGTVAVAWPTAAGSHSDLYDAADLVTGVWRVVVGERAVDGAFTREHQRPDPGHRFYQLQRKDGPRLGYAADDGTTAGMSANGSYLQFCRFTAAEAMEVSSVKARLCSRSGKWKCAIYAIDGAGTLSLLRSTVEIAITDVSDTWVSFPLTAPLTLAAGSRYGLVMWTDQDNTDGRFYRTGGGAGTMSWKQVAYGEWPVTLTNLPSAGYSIGIYAE